jgi:DNA-binding CsgD family transcriptional regulator
MNLNSLSPAELRVAAAVATGAPNKAVAEQLFISVKTVDYHLQNIYRKLGARSRTELAILMAGAERDVLTPDQIRFLESLSDQPAVPRVSFRIAGDPGFDAGVDVAQETGD